jgi:hypothetical protein
MRLKGREMQAAGKMVKGDIRGPRNDPFKKTFADSSPMLGQTEAGDKLAVDESIGPWNSNRVFTINNETKTTSYSYPEGEVQKMMWIMVGDAAAQEWIEWSLSYGAMEAFIVDPATLEDIFPLPDAAILDQYVTQV